MPDKALINNKGYFQGRFKRFPPSCAPTLPPFAILWLWAPLMPFSDLFPEWPLAVDSSIAVANRSLRRVFVSVPEDPYPPNSGGDDFTPRIWGVWLKKHCKTRDFWRFTTQIWGVNFTPQIWGVWVFRVCASLKGVLDTLTTQTPLIKGVEVHPLN